MLINYPLFNDICVHHILCCRRKANMQWMHNTYP